MFGGLAAIIITLGGAAMGLQRLGIIRSKPDATPATDDSNAEDLTARVTDLESRTAILEERTRKHEISLEGIGKLHRRIDNLTETSGRIEGEVTQMNRTLQVMLRHMLGENKE